MWIAATLIAALAQTGRNAAQAGLTARIGTLGATGVRFLFGLPFAALFLLAVAQVAPLPALTARAAGWALVGALAQIAATALMLSAMQRRGFAVATALVKTEPLTLALMGAAVLAEPLGPARLGAIATATLGVLLLSGGGWQRAGGRPVALAVAAGALFGLSALGFRAAILALGEGPSVVRASVVLVLALAIQTLLIGGWLAVRDRRALRGMASAWRESLGAGFLGALASQFWFIAFALAPAADVRTLALVEVVFAAAVSRRRREAMGRRELAGMALVVAGVAWLLRAA
ncbi:EamA family transporter [Paracoccus sanguinis]|uniref:EamA family transporter n=1 Tax=Paracoccus sanguinis TaxID=1545044 RepID=UPI00051FF34B|nr:EamA family transporter [Paracoccus sanguinis]KGJ21865.1 multidrug DMT transporter permease [Paracoccus sanguinis]